MALMSSPLDFACQELLSARCIIRGGVTSGSRGGGDLVPLAWMCLMRLLPYSSCTLYHEHTSILSKSWHSSILKHIKLADCFLLYELNCVVAILNPPSKYVTKYFSWNNTDSVSLFRAWQQKGRTLKFDCKRTVCNVHSELWLHNKERIINQAPVRSWIDLTSCIS